MEAMAVETTTIANQPVDANLSLEHENNVFWKGVLLGLESSMEMASKR